MKLLIKTSEEKDIEAIHSLMVEFAEQQDLQEFLEISEAKLCDILFGKNTFVKSLAAFADEKLIAYAFFYPHFSSFRGQRSVYLEDIFISEKYRGFGIGEKLLRKIAKCGEEEFGAVRMDFQVLKSNVAGRKFYEKHGAAIENKERHTKITDKNFRTLTEK